MDNGIFSYRIRTNYALLGPKYGKRLRAIDAALHEMNPFAVADLVRQGHSVSVMDTIDLLPQEIIVDIIGAKGYAVAEDKGFTVALDTTLTPALIREGMANDLIHAIQGMRKRAAFAISDTIDCWITMAGTPEGEREMRRMLWEHLIHIGKETRVKKVTAGQSPAGAATMALTIGGVALVIGIMVSTLSTITD